MSEVKTGSYVKSGRGGGWKRLENKDVRSYSW